MKLFEKNQTAKSWSLELKSNEVCKDKLNLVAVDSNTGNHIAYVMDFYPNGRVHICDNFAKALIRAGYDPFEHNNSYDAFGKIIID